MSKIIFFLLYAIKVLFRICHERFYHFYNIQLLKFKGVTIGGNCHINGKMLISITSTGRLKIGNDFICRSGFGGHILGGEYSAFHISGTCTIGDNSGMSATCICCSDHVSIGSNVMIGAGCFITDSNHHSIDWKSRCNGVDHDIKTAPVSIGDCVFIGAKSIVLKGVHIGARSVIAAGSVVVHDIPADVIAGGNPCKVIKNL